MISRRDFCKSSLGGVVVLGSLEPLNAVAKAVLTNIHDSVSISGLDDECKVFAECLQELPIPPSVFLSFDGSPDQIAVLRMQLRENRDNAGKSVYIAGLVGAHAYPVLETLFRDAGAALLVRGQHVRRKDYEAHAFHSTPTSLGISKLYQRSLSTYLPAHCIRETVIGMHTVTTLDHAIAVQKNGSRLQALARAYSYLIEPEQGKQINMVSLSVENSEQVLNHESFVFRL